MPYTQNQRQAAFAEIENRKRGMMPKMFRGMSKSDLEKWAKKPLEKKKMTGAKMAKMQR